MSPTLGSPSVTPHSTGPKQFLYRLHKTTVNKATQFPYRCGVTSTPNVISAFFNSKQRKIQQTMKGVPSHIATC